MSLQGVSSKFCLFIFYFIAANFSISIITKNYSNEQAVLNGEAFFMPPLTPFLSLMYGSWYNSVSNGLLPHSHIKIFTMKKKLYLFWESHKSDNSYSQFTALHVEIPFEHFQGVFFRKSNLISYFLSICCVSIC